MISILTDHKIDHRALLACVAIMLFSGGLPAETYAFDQPAVIVQTQIDDVSNFQLIAQSDNVVDSSAQSSQGGINFFSLLTQGGWFMIPLLGLSILVVTIGIERFLALRRERVFPPQLIEQLSILSQSPAGLDPRRAYEVCQRFPSSASYILRAMLTKVGRPQLEMESAISDAAQREATRLGHLTSWLSLVAAIAPLIGLLGTVWGITQAFYDTTQ